MIVKILIVITLLITFLIIKFNLSLGTIDNKYQKTKHIVLWYNIKTDYSHIKRDYIYLFTLKIKK